MLLLSILQCKKICKIYRRMKRRVDRVENFPDSLSYYITIFFIFFFFNSRFRRTRSKTAEEKVGETIGSIGSEMSCKINRAVPQLDLSLLLLLLYGFFFHAHACTNRRMHAHAKKFTLINFNQ